MVELILSWPVGWPRSSCCSPPALLETETLGLESRHLESRAKGAAGLDLEVSAGWVSSPSRGLWGGHGLLLSRIRGMTRLCGTPRVCAGTMLWVNLDSTKGDAYCPTSHTCTLTIDLPAYSSQKVLQERLLYAIHNCREIDTDFTARDFGTRCEPPHTSHAAVSTMRERERESGAAAGAKMHSIFIYGLTACTPPRVWMRVSDVSEPNRGGRG